jgi:periplasmic divalent cation tolerance protein
VGSGADQNDRSERAAQVRIVLSTHSALEPARALARAAVEAHLAACVNILDGALSVYRWNGAIEEAREVLLVVKTSAERLPELEQLWRERHGYDTPEWVVLRPADVGERYLDWLLGQTR